MENVLINRLELASELAYIKLLDNWTNKIKIFEDENASITNYTDEAQDIFNEYYEFYEDLIQTLIIR